MGPIKQLLAIGALAVLTACGTPNVYDSDLDVQRASYTHGGQPSLTLLTMISNTSGAGGHSALLINASQRVMYDPAGRWKSSLVAERNDLLFGITPQALKKYNSFHARDTHHVLIQEIPVSAEVAEMAYRLSVSQGRSMDAMCASNTSAILRQLPGFEGLKSSLFPAKLAESFASLPNVKTDKYFENDVGQN